jgi:hypothetical protein
MSDAYTKARFGLLDMIAQDPNTNAAAFKLAYLLATRFVNGDRPRKDGVLEAWPSQEDLAEAYGATPRAIRELTHQLVANGHLEFKVQRPRSTYRFKLNRQEASASKRKEGSATRGRAAIPILTA